ncbi:MAG: hypothetical protein QM523_08105 [Candidatus Pacebacteria bacterium]|nr:hypothetical protein [Candidatus Paceibacterota bacterium]
MDGSLAVKEEGLEGLDYDPLTDPHLLFDPNESQEVSPGFDPHGSSYKNMAELKLCLQVAIDQIERGEYIVVTDISAFMEEIWQRVLKNNGLNPSNV